MVTKITRWYPDTCECIIEYSWDSESSEDTRVHTPTTMVQRCSVHTTTGDVVANYNILIEESKRKNYTYDDILQTVPSDWFDLDADSGARVFKKGIVISWTWSGTAPNRVLTITVTGKTFTQQQRNAIQNKLDQRFGVGKVILA